MKIRDRSTRVIDIDDLSSITTLSREAPLSVLTTFGATTNLSILGTIRTAIDEIGGHSEASHTDTT